jgi:preprotein translocase subunit SecE
MNGWLLIKNMPACPCFQMLFGRDTFNFLNELLQKWSTALLLAWEEEGHFKPVVGLSAVNCCERVSHVGHALNYTAKCWVVHRHMNTAAGTWPIQIVNIKFRSLYICTALSTVAHKRILTLNLLTSTIVAHPSKASKWQMGFNSAFKGLTKKIIHYSSHSIQIIVLTVALFYIAYVSTLYIRDGGFNIMYSFILMSPWLCRVVTETWLCIIL